MPRGGARPGAGRKKSSLTEKTRAIAERATAEGVTPLEVMLQVMAELLLAGEKEKAASVAKDAAPYCHPKLSAVEVAGKDGGDLIIKIVKFSDA